MLARALAVTRPVDHGLDVVKGDASPAGPFVGIGGLAIAAFLYGYTAIALPSWLHSLVMPLFWVALLVCACVWFTPRPRRLVWLPVVAIVVWFALVLGLGPNA